MKACQATKGVLTGLPRADLREWTVPWWVCHDTFDGVGRHKPERMRKAPMMAARERSSSPHGVMLCRMLACGRSEAWWLVTLSGPFSWQILGVHYKQSISHGNMRFTLALELG